MPLSPFTIWTDPDRTRYFLLPDPLVLPEGSYAIRAPLGKQQSVDPQSLLLYEITEQQAKVWVASELTGIIDALPKSPSRTGARILAAGQLVRKLPEVIRLSMDKTTLGAAREAGAALDALLSAAGIESHSAFARLPDRVYEISRDPTIRSKRREIAAALRSASNEIEIPEIRRFLDALSGRVDDDGKE
jgi:hypothetical protein